jgi:ribosomal protein L25 (general stress protein Ctc)
MPFSHGTMLRSSRFRQAANDTQSIAYGKETTRHGLCVQRVDMMNYSRSIQEMYGNVLNISTNKNEHHTNIHKLPDFFLHKLRVFFCTSSIQTWPLRPSCPPPSKPESSRKPWTAAGLSGSVLA